MVRLVVVLVLLQFTLQFTHQKGSSGLGYVLVTL